VLILKVVRAAFCAIFASVDLKWVSPTAFLQVLGRRGNPQKEALKFVTGVSVREGELLHNSDIPDE
jgi:hypothetical protein